MSIAARATAESNSLEHNFRRFIELYHDIRQRRLAISRSNVKDPPSSGKSAA
jgi:hypothetical protein